ncbi:MAG TPA: PspC domain-containing protein [Bacteroidota bacterium]|jgi:phage shock protein PspC (stress-responsive transcriptional regulator)
MKRLYRSDTNKKLAGICGGIGEMTDTDPTIIRLIAVIAGVVTGIIPFVLAYIIAWWIVPPRKQEQAESRPGA